MFNFREIEEEIVTGNAGVRVDNAAGLTGKLEEIFSSPERQREMGEKGYQIILKNKGAVDRNLAIVEKFL